MSRYWTIIDLFGFQWGDVFETLDEAREALKRLREDPHIREWGIELEIEERREG